MKTMQGIRIKLPEGLRNTFIKFVYEDLTNSFSIYNITIPSVLSGRFGCYTHPTKEASKIVNSYLIAKPCN